MNVSFSYFNIYPVDISEIFAITDALKVKARFGGLLRLYCDLVSLSISDFAVSLSISDFP